MLCGSSIHLTQAASIHEPVATALGVAISTLPEVCPVAASIHEPIATAYTISVTFGLTLTATLRIAVASTLHHIKCERLRRLPRLLRIGPAG